METESLIVRVSRMFGDMRIENTRFKSVITKYEKKKSRQADILDFEKRNDFPLKAPIAALYMDKLMPINPIKPH